MLTIRIPHQGRTHELEFAKLSAEQLEATEEANQRTVDDALEDQPPVAAHRAQWGGVDVDIYRHGSSELLRKGEQLLEQALATLARDGEFGDLFTGLPLEAHFVSTGPSMGYVVRAHQDAPRRAVLIYSEETPDVVREQRSLELNAHGLTYLVGYAVYLYYRPTFSVNALDAFILTTLYHELGHILHHLVSPTHLAVLRLLVSIDGSGDGSFREQPHLAAVARCVTTQKSGRKAFIQALEQSGYGVSVYASDKFIEYVAEVFSGVMMGVPFTSLTYDIYRELGGFQPDNNVCHRRTRNTAHEFLYEWLTHTTTTASFNRGRVLGAGLLTGLQ